MMNTDVPFPKLVPRHALTRASLALGSATICLLVLAGCNPRELSHNPVEAGPSTEFVDEGVAAVIDGRRITVSEVHEHMRNQFLEEFLRQPEDRQFEMRERAVRDIVQEHIIEIEARKQAKTPEEVYEAIENSVPEPTDEEVADWYSKNHGRLRGAKLEDVSGPIKELLVNEGRSQALKAFLDPKLEALAWQMLLAPPRKELATTRLVRGSASAPVTIIAFSDYQCPYCVRAEPILAQVLERYPEQVRLVHRHFPLDTIHPFARPAAEASMCAEEQGKFWEYHDGIFARRGKLEEGSFAEIGSALGLDAEALSSCIEERRYKDFVEADFTAGKEAGVTGTPSFFLNGISLKGARDADDLSRHVDLELARINAD
jgi:predicted DsbA family dithiol-disulfide isomerase